MLRVPTSHPRGSPLRLAVTTVTVEPVLIETLVPGRVVEVLTAPACVWETPPMPPVTRTPEMPAAESAIAISTIGNCFKSFIPCRPKLGRYHILTAAVAHLTPRARHHRTIIVFSVISRDNINMANTGGIIMSQA